MDEASIRKYIAETFDGVDITDASGGSFFFYDPDRKFPFATTTTSDEDDQASDLNRPGVFRLNIGVGKQTFQALFGASGEAGWDFAALDRLMPHPVYGKMYWVCVLNPSPAIFEQVRGLLAEAYDMAVRKRARTGQAGEA